MKCESIIILIQLQSEVTIIVGTLSVNKSYLMLVKVQEILQEAEKMIEKVKGR